jgi:CxxC-x17-CxxC domain-containing protein
VDIQEKERKDFYLYIDEFQNFSTESFATILSEARKYHLNLIVAHQYIEQLTDEVKAAVFGNIGTLVTFRVGAVDAEELVKEFTPTFTEEDLINLPKFEFYVKLMIDGVASAPFSARGLPPLTEEERTNNLEKAIQWTRQNFAKPRAEVEAEIMKQHFAEEVAKPPIAPGREITSATDFPKSSFDKPRESQPAGAPKLEAAAVPRAAGPERKEALKPGAAFYDARCASCGAETKVPFKPDNTRPVYCKNCLSELKKKKRGAGPGDVIEKKEKVNFSRVSPSALLAAGAVSDLPREEGYVSLAKLKETGLSAIVRPGRTKAGLVGFDKKPLTVETSKNPDKELVEGEDIVFE